MDYQIAIKAPRGTVCQVWSCNNPRWCTSNINSVVSAWINSRSWQGYMLFNDEDPDGSSHSCGHVKGIMAYNNEHAVYLLHSVPKWPASFPPGDIPHSELIYGQSFVFMTIPLDRMPGLVDNLSLSDPNVYQQYCFPWWSGSAFGPGQVSYFIVGPNVTYISKNKQWDMDMYADAIVPHFQTPIRVESWLRPANSEQHNDVEDVQNILWENGVSYHSRQDHSKFCISVTKPLCYIGSINHMRSQLKRGGDGFIICDSLLHSCLYPIMVVDSKLHEEHVEIPTEVSALV